MENNFSLSLEELERISQKVWPENLKMAGTGA